MIAKASSITGSSIGSSADARYFRLDRVGKAQLTLWAVVSDTFNAVASESPKFLKVCLSCVQLCLSLLKKRMMKHCIWDAGVY